jgi:hypothetical protein
MWNAGAMLLILGLLAGITGSVQAGPILIDGGWQDPFNWFAVDTFWVDGPFTYSALSQTSLKVTDYFNPGDQFEVYDWGSSLGTTSSPSAGVWTDDPAVAYATSYFSSGEWLLGPGGHSITIETIVAGGITSYGSGALRVDTAAPTVVPAPGAVVLAVIGLGMAGRLGRRRLT